MAKNQPPKVFDALPPHRSLDFSKPKPNFDWDALDQVYNPIIPEGAIQIRDIQEHYGVKERRAQSIVSEAVMKKLLKRVPGQRGWYVKP